MANLIRTVEATGAYQWTASVTVPNKDTPLVFSAVGATFQDGSTQKTIVPDTSKIYTLDLQADAPTDPQIVHHATIYYDDLGDLVLHQGASLNIVCPNVRAMDWRVQTKGFNFLPKGASAPTPIKVSLGNDTSATDADPSTLPLLSSIPVGTLAFTDPLTVFYDSVAKRSYWIANAHNPVAARLVRSQQVDLASIVVRYRPSSYMREVLEFEPTGRVTIRGINAETTLTLPIRPVRVVYSSISKTFKIIDDAGALHVYSATLAPISVDRSHYFVAASADFDAAIDRAGTLILNGVEHHDLFFYQFADDSTLAYGYYKPNATTFSTFNLMSGVLGPKSILTPQDTLLFRAKSAWAQLGGVSTLGPDTTEVNSAVLFGITSNPYGSTVANQKFTYFVQPVEDYRHMALQDYDATLPLFDAPLGPTFVLTFQAVVSDAEMSVPITLPSSIQWNATVRGEPVTSVRNGDQVTLHIDGGDYSSTFFPISLGRSSGLVELIPDSMPDPFEFISVHEQPEDFWYMTETITITGINVRVPITATVNRQIDYSRIKFYINGAETSMPVYIRNNDTLAIEVYHGQYQTLVDLEVGDRSSSFGVYTIDEMPLPELTNWCYMPAGKRVESDLIQNTSPTDLDLEITSANAEFVQGGTAIKLTPGMSTRIVLTTEANNRAHVEFKTIVYEYTWDVWSDDHWIDVLPQEKRAPAMKLTSSDLISFSSFTENWKTVIKVPAGVLIDIGSEEQEGPLDSRGVYSESKEYEIFVQDLVVKAFPRTQAHVLILGDAELPWTCTFPEDPSYEIAAPVVRSFLNTLGQAFRHSVVSFVRDASDRVAFTFGLIPSMFESAPFALPKEFDLKFVSHEGKAHEIELKQVEGRLTGGPEYFDLSTLTPAFTSVFKRFDLPAPRYVAYPVENSDLSDPRHVFGPVFEVDVSKPEYVTNIGLLLDYLDRVRHVNYLMHSMKSSGVEYYHLRTPFGADTAPPQYLRRENAYAEIAFGKHVGAPVFRRADPADPQYMTHAYNWGTMEVSRIYDVYQYYHVGTAHKWLNPGGPHAYELYITVSIVNRPKKYPIDTDARWVGGNSSWGTTPAHAAQLVPVHARPVELTAKAAQYYSVHHYEVNRAQYVKRPIERWVGMSPRYTFAPPALLLSTDPRFVPYPVMMHPAMEPPDHVATYNVHPVEDRMLPQKIPSPVFRIQGPQKRSARAVVVLPLPERQFFTPETELDPEDPNPLNKGYFETEQLALQDAITVWGHDPSVIRALPRADGSWYWVQIIPCDNSCGWLSCDDAGYLTGG